MPSAARTALPVIAAAALGLALLRKDPETGESALDRFLGSGQGGQSGSQDAAAGGGGSSPYFPDEVGPGPEPQPEPEPDHVGPGPDPDPDGGGGGGKEPSYLSRLGSAALDPYTLATAGIFAAPAIIRGVAPAARAVGRAALGAGRGVAQGASRAGQVAARVGGTVLRSPVTRAAGPVAAGVAVGLAGTYALEKSGALDAVANVGQNTGAALNRSAVGRSAVTAVQVATTPLQVVGALATAAVGRGNVKDNLSDATQGVRKVGRGISKFARKVF